MVRLIASLVGIVAGVVLAPLSLAGMFTLRNEDLPEGIVALMTPLLLLPLVIVAAIRPRRGGQLLIGAAVASAGAYVWSLASAAEGPGEEAMAIGMLYAAIAVLGAVFLWCGRTRVRK